MCEKKTTNWMQMNVIWSVNIVPIHLVVLLMFATKLSKKATQTSQTKKTSRTDTTNKQHCKWSDKLKRHNHTVHLAVVYFILLSFFLPYNMAGNFRRFPFFMLSSWKFKSLHSNVRECFACVEVLCVNVVHPREFTTFSKMMGCIYGYWYTNLQMVLHWKKFYSDFFGRISHRCYLY